MLFQLFENPLAFLLFAIPLLLALVVHELLHAWVADRLGDPTPRLSGRISFNPLAHLDPVGTIALFLIGFGWAKPVPVDSRNFRNQYDEVLVALAGPFANLSLAVLIGLLLRLVPVSPLVEDYAALFVLINVNLMVFNLLPIPPLDGSRILQLFFSPQTYQAIEQVGSMILFGLVLLSLVGNVPIFEPLFEATTVPLTELIIGRSL